MDQINWPTFHRDFPITLGMLLVSGVFFLGYHTGFIGPQLAFPGVMNLQSWTAHFFHSSFWHLGSNTLMCVFGGLLLERRIGSDRYMFCVLCIWNLLVLSLFLFGQNPVYGFSGIAMGLMAFATLYHQNNPALYQLLLPLLLINLAFGLVPGVSWWGHAFGLLAGVITYMLFLFLRR